MFVVIDNYDSFTYNLVQILGRFEKDLLVVRNDQTTVGEIAAMEPEGILISPGPSTPASAGVSVPLIRALGPAVPILGVCLGHQCIGEAFGGRVVRAPEPVHGKTWEVLHDGKGVFAGLPEPLVAVRYHSLVVERAGLPSDLLVTAWTRDGLVMGLRHRRYPVEGVQFHPESMLTQAGEKLLANFLDLARKKAKNRCEEVETC